MKKIIFIVAASVMVTGGAIFAVVGFGGKTMSDFLLANVEALANGEEFFSGYMTVSARCSSCGADYEGCVMGGNVCILGAPSSATCHR